MLSRFTPPTGFLLGPVHLYYYSLCLLGAVWAAYWLAHRQRGRFQLSEGAITDTVALAFIGGVLGARLGYVVQNLSYFQQHLNEIWHLSTGGLSIHSGIIGGLIVLWLVAKQQKIPFFRLTDAFTLPLLAGQIIGRLGNYFNQELFGYPTNLPWKLLIDPAHRPVGYFNNQYFHPTFLYEMILLGLGFSILWRFKPKKSGQLTAAYLLVFATARLITEIWRISDRIVGPLSLAQLISLGLIIFSIYWLGPINHIFKKL